MGLNSKMNADRERELHRLWSVRADFHRALDAINAFYDYFTLDDHIEAAKFALETAIVDLDGYIENRSIRYRVYYIATEANKGVTTGTMRQDEHTYDNWTDATKRMEAQRRIIWYVGKTGSEPWYVGIREEKG